MDILKPNTWFKTSEEVDRASARDIKDEKERDKTLIKIDFKYGHISKDEHDKKIATLDGEPWVKVIKMELEKDKPGSGFFEIDFNEDFVEYLANNGYEGSDNDSIVDGWFNDLCKNIVMEGLEDGEGNSKSFDSKSKEGLIVQRLKTGDDTAEYS
tara:strand:- start:1228 stop:1692 length:465 start_codon:yes stop_codon:yes gene_type:complete